MMSLMSIEVSEDDFRDPVMFQIGYLNQIPHIKQREVLLSKQKNKIIVCGRRSGKTQMIAGELVRGSILDLYHRQLLVAPTFKQAMIVYNKIVELMQKAGVYDDIEREIKNPYPRLVFRNGAYISFGSADNPNSLRGEAYDRVFKDESAFIKKGADDAIKPLTYDVGAPVWETTTPWGKGEVWERWLRGIKGDSDYGCFHYCYLDNPYITDEGKKEIEKDIKEFGENSLYVQAEIYGNFIEDRDAYFSRELVESCITEYQLGEFNPKHMYALGVDFARMGQDESLFIVTGKGRDDIVTVNWIETTSQKLLTDAIGRVKMLDAKYMFARCYLDETGLGSGPTDVLSEDMGTDRIEGVRFSIRSKMDMYSNLKRMMEQGNLKIPNVPKLIYQLMDLRYEVMSNGDLKLHHSDRGHDDYPDALALSCWYWKGEDVEMYCPFFR
jgi:phage terminase large subunit-like protein